MGESGQSSEGAQTSSPNETQKTPTGQPQGKTQEKTSDFYREDPTGKQFVAQTQKNPHVLPVPEGEELDRMLEEERKAHPGQGEADLLTRVTDRLYNKEAARLGNERLAQRAQERGLPVPQPKTQESPSASKEQLPEPSPEDALRFLGPNADENEE